MCTLPNSLRSRRGLTLVELLVVISILVILIGVTIPLVRMVGNNQPVEEATRILEMQIAAAQARAVATGRDTAVVLVRDRTGVAKLPSGEYSVPYPDALNAVYQVAVAESPPPYAGETTAARCSVEQHAVGIGMASFDANVRNLTLTTTVTGTSMSFVAEGDTIRFNYRGPDYMIQTVGWDGMFSFVTFSPEPRVITGPKIKTMPFQIIRAPRRTADPPVNLPPNAFIQIRETQLSSAGLLQASLQAFPFLWVPTANANNTYPDLPPDVQLIFNTRGQLYRVKGVIWQGNTVDPSYVSSVRPARILDPLIITVRAGTPLAPKDVVQYVNISPRPTTGHSSALAPGKLPVGITVP